jgi:biopolymer transport protein ExbD
MHFKGRSHNSSIPEINLTPMLNVMMGILAFFVMITMMLSEEQGVEVQLPAAQSTPLEVEVPPPVLIVQLTPEGQWMVEGETTEKSLLLSQLRLFLQRDQTSIVVLQASDELPYEQVLQALADLKTVGGDRISLAID